MKHTDLMITIQVLGAMLLLAYTLVMRVDAYQSDKPIPAGLPLLFGEKFFVLTWLQFVSANVGMIVNAWNNYPASITEVLTLALVCGIVALGIWLVFGSIIVAMTRPDRFSYPNHVDDEVT